MADESVTTIRGTFATREAADFVVEHLVQEHGISRADIFVEASDLENTSGSAPSGGDTNDDGAEGSSFRPALKGRVHVTADVTHRDAEKAEQVFRDGGAAELTTR